MRKHSIFLVLIIVFLFFEKSSAQHFWDDGFYDGMSQSEATKLFKSMGLRKFGKANIETVGFRVINDHMFIYEIHFCQSKLVSYRKDISPSISNLIFILDKLGSKYGSSFKAYTNIRIGVGGEERKLSFLWETTLYRVEIAYDIYTTNESLTIRYSVPENCSK